MLKHSRDFAIKPVNVRNRLNMVFRFPFLRSLELRARAGRWRSERAGGVGAPSARLVSAPSARGSLALPARAGRWRSERARVVGAPGVRESLALRARRQPLESRLKRTGALLVVPLSDTFLLLQFRTVP